MHWAVWLGAAHIVLVGADCGVIDGTNNVEGYRSPVDIDLDSVAMHKDWEMMLERMAVHVRSLGVSVHSLNPWVTLGLEGHRWEQRR
jgi:hypothetical protein